MFCKYCGTEIPNDATFCPNCGQPVAGTDSSAKNTSQTVNGAGDVSGGEASQPQNSAVSRVQAVTDIGKSTLMLVFIIFFSVELIFGLISMSLSVLNLLTFFISLIVYVGCWLVYRGSLQDHTPTTGFSVLRIGVPLQMVLMLIGAIWSIVIAFRWSFGAASILGYLIEIVLVCWCFYGFYHITNDGWKMANGEDATWNVTASCFAAVLVMAIFEVVGTILYMRYFYSVAAIVSYLATAGVWILAVVILSAIRKQK